MKDAETAGKETTEENLLAFAKDAGFDVTLDEMQEFFKGLEEAQKGELSEVELDLVAGGKLSGNLVNASIATLVIGCALASIMARRKTLLA